MVKIYRVKSIEGRQVVHPATIGTGQQHRIGYRKTTDGVTHPRGIAEPARAFVRCDDPEVVVDNASGYIRERILDGDLAYVETLDAVDAEEGSGELEPELVDATARGLAAAREEGMRPGDAS